MAAFYYQHRLSEDIDLFCEKVEVNPSLTDSFLEKIKKKLKLVKRNRSQMLGLVSYKLIFKNLEIDSVYDIAVNKVHTIFMKPRVRDFFDLYYILKIEKNYNLQKLILDAKAKFDWHIDRMNLSSQFLRVGEFLKTKDLPRALVRYNPKEMEDFFLNLAKSLEKEIFE
ncbi:hypothetical protein A3A74_04495 [Candidatus Roizmanbacteria bacterium RIFCSPLOWO2_01_FULL_35_13]|uniref:Nucleotidyl transferase AbiEii/AbiGii toxin family protein n=1 Tax=Candidatus Roizmanbacteria bacterium RIFCSPLOWO2_01_FULL_35_13 TaxID=1802055 RepID=A0A1F7I8N5_9BACT|nr:MAG: hypothetical protein A3A74_04495 [Candidatus Roizmanbacteria bacterium RIFCSPLOWO2_01_FULL_35_13]